MPKPLPGILPRETHEDFFSQTWESKVCFLSEMVPFHIASSGRLHAFLNVLVSIFPSSRASRLDCGGGCISAEEKQDVQPTLKALFANAVLLGMSLIGQHHFCTSKLNSDRDTI